MSAVKYYKSEGKRYYVIAIPGFRVNPDSQDIRSGTGNYKETSTYAVLDRDWMHREMGVFSPGSGGRSEAWAKRSAERLAEKLNEREERDAA